MLRLLFFSTFFLSTLSAFAQSFSFRLEPLDIPALGGLQSFAYGQYKGKWLVIGGRLDGLHRRQPFVSFDLAGHNRQIFVIDPVAKKKWSAPLSSLPAGLQEQLSATNMEFHQEGDFLYIVGGYGYSATLDNHRTYPNCTQVNVPAVINAVLKGEVLTPFFRQITDPSFAVTGGHLEKIYDTYYLVGGHLFDGKYNPQDSSHGPGFLQIYTNQIRKFTIKTTKDSFYVTHLESITDASYLHRRDYNVPPQIMPNGAEGLTAFSGVFQYNSNIPFLHSVDIDSSGYRVNQGFAQYYNHYHCANLPMYDAKTKEMHNVFFGGIAHYLDSLGILVQDSDVPFVPTIARVTRDAQGKMAEYKMEEKMPAFLGASAEFIRNEKLAHHPNGVLKLDKIQADTTLVGYIYGGINSSAANIFWINEGEHSQASSQIFKVFLIKNKAKTNKDALNPQSTNGLALQVFPNINTKILMVKFNLPKIQEVLLTISDEKGTPIIQDKIAETDLMVMGNTFYYEIENLNKGGLLWLRLEVGELKVEQKVLVRP